MGSRYAFELGKTYTTQGGERVTITEVRRFVDGLPVVLGDDGVWRLDTPNDRGVRAGVAPNGTARQAADPRNLVLPDGWEETT